MRAHVVYESMFGNTREIAEAVAIGLSTGGVDVEATEVGVTPARPDPDVDLLVVGAPTHAFSMSRAQTRLSAAEQAIGPLVSAGIGLRDWLEALPPAGTAAVAAFDTHVDKKVPGSAARAAAKRLRRRGHRQLAKPTSFFVADMQGPVLPGELERARQWGADLATTLQATDERRVAG